MARKVATVTINQPEMKAMEAEFDNDGNVVNPARPARSQGRDHGKVFVVTEMPAIPGERWATQALALIIAAGQSMPSGAQEAGMAGLAAAPLASLPVVKALQDPSLDAWWDCVKYQHNPKHPLQEIFQGEACQIEEIATVSLLRVKVLEMHTGFFSDAAPPISAAAHSVRTKAS